MYKACIPDRCKNMDIVTAFAVVVEDGVDIISMSIANVRQVATLCEELLAIVMVACAGNKGPGPSSLRNNAPWLITVAAGSSVDPRLTTTQTRVIIEEAESSLLQRRHVNYPTTYLSGASLSMVCDDMTISSRLDRRELTSRLYGDRAEQIVLIAPDEDDHAELHAGSGSQPIQINPNMCLTTPWVWCM
jgi:hypothetical protein